MPSAPNAQLIDIERERSYWKQRYHSLPRARAMRSFVRYWPVLAAAYDIYLNHPHAGSERSREMFVGCECVAMSPLRPEEASQLFSRVLERIHGSVPRPAPEQPRSGPPA